MDLFLSFYLTLLSTISLVNADRRHQNGPDSAPLMPIGIMSNNNGKSPIVAATYYFNQPPSSAAAAKDLAYSDSSVTKENEIQEDEDTCQAADGRRGTCYDATECLNKGGTPMGRCRNGKPLGTVCCLFEITCGEFSSERFVYFRSPGYPQSNENPQICRVRIGKKSKDICQYKVELLTFALAPPNDGNCSQDVFVVSGQNENNVVPKICGRNSGQHYYFGVDESSVISMHMLMLGLFRRRFDIFISQIACHSDNLAPSHCLQYYTGTHGLIKSFNYDSEYVVSETNLGYPNDIDYIMCIKKESGFCSITYDLSSNGEGALPFAIGAPSATEKGAWRPIVAQCRDDYLSIGGTRLCSGKLKNLQELHEDNVPRQADAVLNATVAYPVVITDTTPGPFVIRFVSNHANNARGFNLTYRQNPCK